MARASMAILLAAALVACATGTARGAQGPGTSPPSGPVAYARIATAVLSGVTTVAAFEGGGGWLAMGFADRVEIGRFVAPYRWTSRFTVPVPSGPTVLAPADLDADGRPDLVIGSGGAGTLTVVADATGDPMVANVVGFLFGAAWRIVAADLDGTAPAELAVTNASGDLFLFAAGSDGGYRRVWRGASNTKVASMQAADLDGDGRAELVTGEKGSAVRVLRWDGIDLRLVGSAYPWGEVMALDVAVPPPAEAPPPAQAPPVDGEAQPPAAVPPEQPPLVIAVTDRRVVYAYRWDEEQLQVAMQAFDARQRIHLAWMRATAGVQLVSGRQVPSVTLEGGGPFGVQIVRMTRDQPQLQWLASTAWVGDIPAFVRLEDRSLLVARPGGQLDVLGLVPAEYLAVLVDGQERSPLPGLRIMWVADVPLVDVTQIGQIVPVSVSYVPGEPAATLRGLTGSVRVYADVPAAQGDQVSVALPVAPQLDREEKRLYVPCDVLRPLGWTLQFDPARRRLTIRSPWPSQGG